ncbi:MAG: PrgI family protein [Candidatus Daviesbacteria bacterium]|nr:PrgI family protein [Candidatus Daviesbacteria bacterium]
MEAHPIPQNVTTFQFHLVGDMTLKQFLYLAAGSGIAYLLFVFVAADYPLIAWPTIVISTLLGIAFAFLPINSRPLDHWLGAFLNAIYSPTKRLWKKNGKSYKDTPAFSSRLTTYLSTLGPTQPIPSLQTPISPFFPSVSQFQKPIFKKAPAPEELPSSDELKKTVELAKQAQVLKQKIVQTERNLVQIRTAATQPHQTPENYSWQVNKILSDLKELVEQASEVKQKLESVGAEQPKVSLPSTQTPKVIKVKLPPRPKQQMALTTFPNVINGVIQDASRNYLQGVVAVIYDKEGLPVRALKTNKLGQFSGSTPLSNGVYTLELEKEAFGFDVLQIELTGQVLPPLIITAKEAIRS